MNKSLPNLIVCLICCLNALTANAETNEDNVECSKTQAFLLPSDATTHLNYAPDREVDLLHLALDVTPDFAHRTVSGKATLQFRPNIKPVREIKLDAVDLSVESVTSSEKIEDYQVGLEKLVITFSEAIPPGKEASVTVSYHAEPDRGLYFRTPEMGYKEGDTHCFVQGEEIEARHWYPCFDSPNEKFTSEVTCRVPDKMTVVSNGRLISEEKDAASGLTAFHWSQEKPHANYLITLVAGYFNRLEGKHKDVPLAFLTPPSEFKDAANSFRETEETMEFLEQEIGVAYPWPKYYQTCVNDFVAGGMENTSATTLTDSTLFRDEEENLRNSQSLVAHEMAHQWFGDLVTCKDWSHVWLNEGFATYYQVLFEGHKNGRDAMLYDLYHNMQRVLEVTDDVNPIVRRSYNDPFEMFGYLAYPKGGWVLHMLRSQLGEELYRKCIKTYLERHQYGNVTTEDLRKVIEELSGRSYDLFFDQWLYHAHYPELDVAYSWDQQAKLAKLSIRQRQKVSDSVLVFDFPLTIRFKGKFGTTDRMVTIKETGEDFYFPLDSAPEIVRVDPNFTLLIKTTIMLPNNMITAQLADTNDMMGRLLAIEQLSNRKDAESVAKLKYALNNDAFHGVRIEAAQALRTIHSDVALTALLDSGKQTDARVRRAVVSALGGFFSESAESFVSKILENEKNPDIQATAIRALAAYGNPEIHDELIKYLATKSFREELASASISAIRSQDDPAYIAPLLKTLQDRRSELPTRAFSQGLGTLGYLGRNELNKDTIREFLQQQLGDKRKSVERAAMSALGSLGDSKALAALDTFTTASHESPERTVAEKAVADLRAARKPVDDYKNLRSEVMDLQKDNRTLRKDLDDLKKKIESKAEVPETAVKPGKKPESKETVPVGKKKNKGQDTAN